MRKSSIRVAASIAVVFGLSTFSAVFANEENVLDSEALLITSGDPADPKYANAGENLRNGVGSIFIQFASTAPGGFLCTASVIGDHHILTAGHCLRNTAPGGEPDTITRLVVILPSGVDYFIDTDAGADISFAVNPGYDFWSPLVGAFAANDIAVIELAEALEGDVDRYDLYRDTDEFGEETRHYGHGVSGKGNKGAVGESSFYMARTGLNMYEQTIAPLLGVPDFLVDTFDQLLHDFDSGGRRHNAMEWWFTSKWACHPENDNPPQAQDGQCTTFKDGSYPDFKGFGKLEVGVAPGDSGGPGFIDGKIAGVHSFGFTHNCQGVTNGTDFSCGLNSSYGEVSGDTRVSSHAGWIDAVVNDVITTTPIPEMVPAAPPAVSATVELAANGKAFMGNVLSRRLRTPITYEEVKERLGLE